MNRLLDEGMALGAGVREAWLDALPAEEQHLARKLRGMLADLRVPALPRASRALKT